MSWFGPNNALNAKRTVVYLNSVHPGPCRCALFQLLQQAFAITCAAAPSQSQSQFDVGSFRNLAVAGYIRTSPPRSHQPQPRSHPSQSLYPAVSLHHAQFSPPRPAPAVCAPLAYTCGPRRPLCRPHVVVAHRTSAAPPARATAGCLLRSFLGRLDAGRTRCCGQRRRACHGVGSPRRWVHDADAAVFAGVRV